VGNWVADEVLYQARIHPEQPAASLTPEQVGGWAALESMGSEGQGPQLGLMAACHNWVVFLDSLAAAACAGLFGLRWLVWIALACLACAGLFGLHGRWLQRQQHGDVSGGQSGQSKAAGRGELACCGPHYHHAVPAPRPPCNLRKLRD
jgi:hypothetical protein